MCATGGSGSCCGDRVCGLAHAGDTDTIAGKGHETYQEVTGSVRRLVTRIVPRRSC